MSYLKRLRNKIQIISKSALSNKFLDSYVVIGGRTLTKKPFNRIAGIVPSDKVMDSKAAHNAIEDGQIEGLK